MRHKVMKVYVGCALKGAPKKFIRLVTEVKKELAERNRGRIIVLEFLGLGVGTDVDVYRVDIGNAMKCDFFVAFIDYPSTGLGMELGEVIRGRKIPFLVLGKYGRDHNRMATGASKNYAHRGCFAEYTSRSNAVRLIEDFAKFHRLLKRFKYN
ncbi:MAG: hypothetical protein WA051_02900 [Minisyncoccia bacterium]